MRTIKALWYRLRLVRAARFAAHNAVLWSAGYQDGVTAAYEAGVTEGYRWGLIRREERAN